MDQRAFGRRRSPHVPKMRRPRSTDPAKTIGSGDSFTRVKLEDVGISRDLSSSAQKMADVVVLALPPGTKVADVSPFPASDAAIEQGCTCPEQTLWPDRLWVALDCPVHELERVPS